MKHPIHDPVDTAASTVSVPVHKSATELVKQAKCEISNLSPIDAHQELAKEEVVLIDVRESDEFAAGRIEGAVLAPRGMLEFYADPSLPYHKPQFDKDRRIILYCASGGRSALSVQTLQNMGYTRVAHIDGGLKAWQTANLPTTK